MTVTANQLQQLYVTYFNRPADAAGLAYWTTALDAGVSLETISSSFAASSEFKTLYGGKPAAELVKAVYLNLFNRAAEPAGVEYWSGVIEQGKISAPDAVAAILRGARNVDEEYAANKVSAASAFTAALDTPAKQTAYGNAASLALASKWLSGVTDNVTLILAKVGLTKTIDQVVTAASGPVKGTLADGYIKGAIVFADANENGKLDDGEAKTTTDDQGNFTLTGGVGTLISIGGTDVATGSAVNGSFKAPAGSTMISPLTTLVHSVASSGNISAAQAEALVKDKLGIADTVNLGSYDPIASAVSKDASTEDKATALKVQSLAAQVNTVMGQVGAVLSGAGVTQGSDGGANAATNALADLIVKADDKVDLGSSDAARQIVKGAAEKAGADETKLAQVDKLAGDAGKAIANLNQAIDAASSKAGADAKSLLTEIAKVQVVAESVEKNMESGAKGGDVSASVTTTTGTALNQAINNATSQVGEITPTAAPTVAPTVAPTAAPTIAPTAAPTIAPTAAPTVAPTAAPTVAPTAAPTVMPTSAPTVAPTAAPTVAPTTAPTVAPTAAPTPAPTTAPTEAPTEAPTVAPTPSPTAAPTAAPTVAPKGLVVSVDSNKVLSFGGTSAGSIEMKLDADNVATFTRGGATAETQPDLDNVAKIALGAGQLLNATAAQLSGRAIEGAGTIVVSNVEAAPNADLGGISVGSLQAVVNVSGETVNLTGKLGNAAVAIHGNGTVNVEKASTAGATFAVDAGAVLVGSASVLSGTVVTGAGSVKVAGADGNQILNIANAGKVSGGLGADQIKLGAGAQVLGYAFGGIPAVRSTDTLRSDSANAAATLPGIAAKLSGGDTLRFTFNDDVYVATMSSGMSLQDAINAAVHNGQSLGMLNIAASISGDDVVLKAYYNFDSVSDAIFRNAEVPRQSDSVTTAYDAVTNFQVGTDKIQLFDAAGNTLVMPSSLTRFADVDGGLVTTAQKLTDLVFKSAAFQALSPMQAGLINVTSGAYAGTYMYVQRPESGGQEAGQDLFIKLVAPQGVGAVGTLNVADYFVQPVDTTPPVAVIGGTRYEESTRTLTFSGTKFSTIHNPGDNTAKDIKAYLDWSKLHWNSMGFTLSDIESARVDGGTLSVTLTAAKHAAVLALPEYDYMLVYADAGFIRDAAGNAAITDAATRSLDTSLIVNLADAGMLSPVSRAREIILSASDAVADNITVDAAGVGTWINIAGLAAGKTLTLVNTDHVRMLTGEVKVGLAGRIIASSSSITYWRDGMGDDQLSYTGSNDAEFFLSGGADVVTGGAGRNIYDFHYQWPENAANMQELIARADTITNWNWTNQPYYSGDKLLVGGHLSEINHTAAAVAGRASISTAGLATFVPEDNTLAKKLDAVNATLGSEFNATVVINHEGSAYVYVHGLELAGVGNTRHLIKLSNVQSTGMIIDPFGYIVSFNSVIDSSPPVAVITGIDFDASEGVLYVAGDDLKTLLSTGQDAVTDLKNNFDWKKLSLKINGTSGNTTISFALADISSAKVLDDGVLKVVLTAGKAAVVAAAAGFGGPIADTFSVTAGFLKDGSGNADTLDAASGDLHSVYTAHITSGDMLVPASHADHVTLDVQVPNAIVNASALTASSVSVVLGVGKSLNVTNLNNVTHLSALGQEGNLIAQGSGVLYFEGGNGSDVLTSTSTGAVTFIGGAGADLMTGGTGANTFVYNAQGDFSAATAANLMTQVDTIANWNAGSGNTIYFGGKTLTAITHADAASAGKATIAANGLATFDGTDSTLAKKLDAVISAVGTDDIGTLVVFNDGSAAYLFVVGNSTAGVQAGDALIKLPGVTATGLVFQDGMVTGLNGGGSSLTGMDGADTLTGTRFNDVLNGGLGNDMLNGGEGTDTAIFSGTLASSSVTKSADGYTVQGPNGTDSLVGVERLKFDNMALALDIDGVPGQAYRMYHMAFSRTPDAAGLGYWISQMDAGMRLIDVANGFSKSTEFTTLAGTTPDSIITYLYDSVLHRAPEQSGFDYWVSLVKNNVVSIPEVMTSFSESAENVAGLASLIGQGIQYKPYMGA